MSYRENNSIFESDFVNTLVFVGAALIVAGVVVVARTEFRTTTALLIGAVFVVPSFLASFSVAYLIDRSRGPRLTTSTHGVTLSGVLYAEAFILAYSPMFVLQDRPWDWGVALTAWGLAAASAWGGAKAKKWRRARRDLARLAEVNVGLATRFLVRPDKKGWVEIEPYTVLAYQRAFEKALTAIGEPLPRSHDLSIEHGKKLIEVVENEHSLGLPRREDAGSFEYGPDYYPGVVVALVLTYLDAPPADREKEKAEWAAAMATRLNASRVRDSVRPMVETLFKNHARRYR